MTNRLEADGKQMRTDRRSRFGKNRRSYRPAGIRISRHTDLPGMPAGARTQCGPAECGSSRHIGPIDMPDSARTRSRHQRSCRWSGTAGHRTHSTIRRVSRPAPMCRSRRIPGSCRQSIRRTQPRLTCQHKGCMCHAYRRPPGRQLRKPCHPRSARCRGNSYPKQSCTASPVGMHRHHPARRNRSIAHSGQLLCKPSAQRTTPP
jgi:hypothetical protein